MGRRGVQVGLVALAIFAPWPAGALAEPASGPRESVDQSFTTTRPGSPTGADYTAAYHAAGDPSSDPPYMRRMAFYPPKGMRYDTSVPDRCTASDAELELRGADACPAASRLGRGMAEGIFWFPVTHSFVFDHYKHTTDIFNNANEQVVLVNSEGSTVIRGRFQPDGSIEYTPTTCFPAPPAGVKCADDYIVQLKSATNIPAYTRAIGGRLRSYATTPPKCPAKRYWKTTIRFWWSDGSADTVASRQPCTRKRSRSS